MQKISSLNDIVGCQRLPHRVLRAKGRSLYSRSPARNDGGILPLEKSFLEIGDVVVSAVKKACDSDATIIRMFNPYETAKSVALKGTEVNLNEDEIKEFDGIIRPKKIVSVKIRN